jgi:hypothetical protein
LSAKKPTCTSVAQPWRIGELRRQQAKQLGPDFLRRARLRLGLAGDQQQRRGEQQDNALHLASAASSASRNRSRKFAAEPRRAEGRDADRFAVGVADQLHEAVELAPRLTGAWCG